MSAEVPKITVFTGVLLLARVMLVRLLVFGGNRSYIKERSVALKRFGQGYFLW